MNVSRSGSAAGSRSDDADDTLVNVHPPMHTNDSAEVDERSEEGTPGTGCSYGADEDGLFAHCQSELFSHGQQQSAEPLDQLTGQSEENAVPVYY